MPKIDIKAFSKDPLAFFDALTVPSAFGPKQFGGIMAPHQREWFEAIAPSLLAVAAGEKPPITRFWTERSKGASKNSDCGLCLLWLLSFCPHKLDMECGASDRDQSAELKKAIVDVIRLNGWLSDRIDVQAWTLLCKSTGSQCSIISSDVASAHGSRPDILVCNELSHVQKEEFCQNLLDNSSKKPRGLVIICTNAGFQGSWQMNWRKIAQESPRWHFNQFSQPAPWLGDEELEEARRRNSNARFRRLFWGDWVSQSGDAFDQADIDASVDPSLSPHRSKQENWIYTAGLDLGVKSDHSALVILASNRETLEIRLVYARNWKPDPKSRRVDLMAVEAAILDAHRNFNLASCHYDPYECRLMAQRLELQRVRMAEMKFVGANLNEMASCLLDTFRSHRIKMYPHQGLIDDLSRLFIEEKSYGHRLSAVRNESGHADLATALAICLPAAVAEAGRVPISIGVWSDGDQGTSAFEQAMRAMEYKNEELQQEQEWLSQPDNDQDDMREAFRLCGR